MLILKFAGIIAINIVFLCIYELKEKTCLLFNHFNFNVLDLDRSLEFYDKALGLKPVRENHGDNFTLVYLGDGKKRFSAGTHVFTRPQGAI